MLNRKLLLLLLLVLDYVILDTLLYNCFGFVFICAYELNTKSMAGRKQNSVWLYNEKLANPGKTGCGAQCKQCGKDIQGLVTCTKQHQSI